MIREDFQEMVTFERNLQDVRNRDSWNVWESILGNQEQYRLRPD